MFITAIYALECAMKIVCFGFYLENDSYISDNWNKLDFIIIVLALIEYMVENVNLNFVKIVRLLRILRPLRFLTRNKNLKVLVNSLFDSMNGVMNIILVILLILYIIYNSSIFALLFINLFQGVLGFCYLNNVYPPYNINKNTCIKMQGNW